MDLGSRHSPDFVCSPFKYNLGNYLEALEEGATVLFQTGLGCRYGYYGELQEQILRDLGHDFRFVCLSRERARLGVICRSLGELGCTLSRAGILHALFLACESCRLLDHFDNFMRESVGFEVAPGTLAALREDLLLTLSRADSLPQLRRAEAACRRACAGVKLDKPERPLRVGIVGELYTVMEPYSNFFVERRLAREGIAVSRVMGIWFLLFGQQRARSLGRCGGYLRYLVGANGVHSVSQSLRYAREGYDGILHLKSFGCIPELSATPALLALSRDYDIPILDLSFDTQTSETGIETRLEAFADMIRLKQGGCPWPSQPA